MSRFRKQLNRHDPENGVWGDCHRAAWAAMLDIPFDEVPHFFDGGNVERGIEMERKFLAGLGLVAISVAFPEKEALDWLLTWTEAMHPGVMHLLGGTSRNGTDHTVVCRNGAIILDPSLDDSGIVGPCRDGYYWLTFAGVADPAKRFGRTP